MVDMFVAGGGLGLCRLATDGGGGGVEGGCFDGGGCGCVE